jgi:tRNA G26 N,N-dimethylase Trm1
LGIGDWGLGPIPNPQSPFFNFSANEICKSKNKSKITVKDVLEAMEKAGFENFQPEIENLLMGK